MCDAKPSFSNFTAAVSTFVALTLSGCLSPDANKETRLSIPVPEAISVETVQKQSNVTARIEIPSLGISTPLRVEKSRANGIWPQLPPGKYTVNIFFETNHPDFGNITLAKASKEANIAPGGNTLSFYKSDYSYPDDDEDRYNNLAEVVAGTDPRNGNSMPQPARVFVTSVSGTAKLSSWPDAGGKSGLAAGDAICQARADAAGLGGRFVAWLSDRNHDAYCRVHGLSGKISEDCGQDTLPEDAGPWVRMDGYPVADGISDLTRNGSIYTPLVFIESGEQIFRNGAFNLAIHIWTGTDTAGAWAENLWTETPDGSIAWGTGGDCNGWESDDPDLPAIARGMLFHTDRGWTSQISPGDCSDTAALACFEIDNHMPLPDFSEPGKRVFVTSVYGPGDLSSWADANGKRGISAGDAICRARAGVAGLPNADKFKAFLADDTTAAIDRLISDGPWVRMDGVPVAKTKRDLMVSWPGNGAEGGIFSSILLNEEGEYINDSHTMVWVGAEQKGQSTPYNCSNWTSADEGVEGTIALTSLSDLMWLVPNPDVGRQPCNLPLRLYCFEDE